MEVFPLFSVAFPRLHADELYKFTYNKKQYHTIVSAERSESNLTDDFVKHIIVLFGQRILATT
jgi:hypothetical protein